MAIKIKEKPNPYGDIAEKSDPRVVKRKRKKKEKQDEQMHFHVSAALKREFKLYATIQGKSMKELLLEMFELHKKQYS